MPAETSTRALEKVLLVFPPTRVRSEQIVACMPPLGALYLAAVFRQRYEVEILDATAEGFANTVNLGGGFRQVGLTEVQIRDRIASSGPDFVGVTCLFSSSYPAARMVCRAAKAVDPGIHTCVGGTHPTFLARQCLEEEPLIDSIVLGEGEMSGLALLDALNGRGALEDIDGLAWRDGDAIRIQPKTTFIENLDSLPRPARDLVDFGLYAKASRAHGVYSKERVTTTIQTSRGCPARCTFCSSMKYWGNKYRGRSAESVLDEIEEVVQRYGIREIQFEDDNLTMDKRRARKIFEGIIDRKLDIAWSTPNGIAMWTLDEELLALMKRAGCYEVSLAFESGNQDVLRNVIKKPLNLKRAEEVVRAVQKIGLDHNAFFVMGFPSETKRQMQDSYELAKRLKLQSAWFFVANPLPGTELYEECLEKGLLADDYDPTNIAYTRSNFRSDNWTSEEVERLVQSSLLKVQLLSHLRQPIHHLRRYLARPGWTLSLISLVVRRLGRSLMTNVGLEKANEPGSPSPARRTPTLERTVDVHVPVRFDLESATAATHSPHAPQA